MVELDGVHRGIIGTEQTDDFDLVVITTYSIM